MPVKYQWQNIESFGFPVLHNDLCSEKLFESQRDNAKII